MDLMDDMDWMDHGRHGLAASPIKLVRFLVGLPVLFLLAAGCQKPPAGVPSGLEEIAHPDLAAMFFHGEHG